MSAGLRLLYSYWVAARGEKFMPSRADIDPVTMPRQLLSNIVLLDVLDNPLGFRYRVMGTAVAAMIGADWTGRRVDEMRSADERDPTQYIETVERGEPTAYFNEYDNFDSILAESTRQRYERILLPLSGTGEFVSMLLGAVLVE